MTTSLYLPYCSNFWIKLRETLIETKSLPLNIIFGEILRYLNVEVENAYVDELVILEWIFWVQTTENEYTVAGFKFVNLITKTEYDIKDVAGTKVILLESTEVLFAGLDQ